MHKQLKSSLWCIIGLYFKIISQIKWWCWDGWRTFLRIGILKQRVTVWSWIPAKHYSGSNNPNPYLMQYLYRTFVSITYLEINFNVGNIFYPSPNPHTWGERNNPRKQGGLFWNTARGREIKKARDFLIFIGKKWQHFS